MKIQAAVTKEPKGGFSIADVELDAPMHDEVLVRIVASGICHTDAAFMENGWVPAPLILGHEGSGIVEQVGASVTHVKPGDHVVLAPAYCGECDNCLSGQQALCLRYNEINLSGKHSDGTHRMHCCGEDVSTFLGQSSFSTYSVAHKSSVVKVDKDIDIVLLGPLACGVQTGAGAVMNTLNPKPGLSVAVFGAGTVGLSAVMAAKIVGYERIIMVDVHDSRLALAKELGATDVINGKELNAVDEIIRLTGNGVHHAIEAAGVPAVVKQALNCVRPGGKTIMLGIVGELTLNMVQDLSMRGVTLIGSKGAGETSQVFIPKLAKLHKDGKLPFDKFVKFYPFEDIELAFQEAKSGAVVKPILKMDPL